MVLSRRRGSYNAPAPFTVASMFENSDIALDDLPAAAQLERRKLASRFVPRLQVQALATGAVAAAALLVLRFAPLDVYVPFAPAWTLLLLATLSGLVWPYISVPRKSYAIRKHDVVYRSGVLWRFENAVPFNRVQHVETSSTPLDRAFGIATLHLYTAGGSGGDLRIHGLPADVAERLRLFILERAGSIVEG